MPSPVRSDSTAARDHQIPRTDSRPRSHVHPQQQRPRRHPHDDAPDTAEAFRRLARLPDGEPKDRLRQEIATDWLPMAHRLAARYRNRGESLDDLQQVAALGLVKAVCRYDPGRGTAFESYAVPTIDGEIKRHFRDCMWSVHVPRRVQVLRSRVRTARQELTQCGTMRSPTLADIAAHAGLSEEEAADGLEALDAFTSLSLDAQTQAQADIGPMSLGETLGAPDPAIDTVVDREAVKPQLCRLPERERRILYMRFFRGMTQSTIAETLGISQMHVSRLISRSCATIREEIVREPEEPVDAAGPGSGANTAAATRGRADSGVGMNTGRRRHAGAHAHPDASAARARRARTTRTGANAAGAHRAA